MGGYVHIGYSEMTCLFTQNVNNVYVKMKSYANGNGITSI